jgi:hypothetical protein
MSGLKKSGVVDALLSYLQHKMPAYPFDPKIDPDFVDELVVDFAGEVDVLEETKSFRWYYSNEPATRMRSMRLGLRRWIANARNRRPRPGA